MNPSFDLVDTPWIPCIDVNGRLAEFGLRATLKGADQLVEISGDSPIVTAALYRLLLAILHRAYQGPDSYDSWGELWKNGDGPFDATVIDSYLDSQQANFDLFHPSQPFFQAPDERVQEKSVASMMLDVASGNNATLFDHHTESDGITLSPAQAARHLVAAQAFGLAGLSGLPQKFTYAPCVGGILFLVQGQTLFQTLVLNMLRYVDDDPIRQLGEDRPAWELEDPFDGRESEVPNGYLDYLTWQNRRILLMPERRLDGQWVVRRMTMAPGLRMDGEIQDPMMHYDANNKANRPFPMRFSEGKALWRDSSALFRPGTAEGLRPPLVLDWLGELEANGLVARSATRRIFALGMANDQAKVEFFRSERMPLHSEYLHDRSLAEALDHSLADAEAVARQLWGAARTLATYLVTSEADAPDAHQAQAQDLNQMMGPWGVERRYWASLEAPFMATLEALPDDRDRAKDSWDSTLKQTAWNALDGVIQSLADSPRELKAAVYARGQLAAGLAKIFKAK